MFCIDSRSTDIYFNLAAEEYLLKWKQDDFFMVWQSAPSVVIGKNQSVSGEVDEEYALKENINLARRFSGGGAVYHDKGNVNLTFIETTAQPLFEVYLQRVVDFLETLGVYAYADERLGIYIDGKKISGSAQCIHKDRVMYHCTLLFATDIAKLNAVLNGRYPDGELVSGLGAVRAVPSVRSEVTNIHRYLDSPVTTKRFFHLLYHYFLTEEEENAIYHYSKTDLAAIELLRREKYANEDWVHHRVALKKI